MNSCFGVSQAWGRSVQLTLRPRGGLLKWHLPKLKATHASIRRSAGKRDGFDSLDCGCAAADGGGFSAATRVRRAPGRGEPSAARGLPVISVTRRGCRDEFLCRASRTLLAARGSWSPAGGAGGCPVDLLAEIMRRNCMNTFEHPLRHLVPA